MGTSVNKAIGKAIPVIDLFAGPGGLGEGFSRAGNGELFDVKVSVEMDAYAHLTLETRALQRRLDPGGYVPDELVDLLESTSTRSRLEARQKLHERFGRESAQARREALCLELGKHNKQIYAAIRDALESDRNDNDWVLIGGPPCQAFSLAGRARNSRRRRSGEYRPEMDHRNFLYREYLKIIAEFRPAIFVMENVKGMLSSRVGGNAMFDQIREDLENPNTALSGSRKQKARGKGSDNEYTLYPIVEIDRPGLCEDEYDPKGHIVRCEQYGVPQKRHRVIIIGVRSDRNRLAWDSFLLSPSLGGEVSCSDVIDDLPNVRSRISRGGDSEAGWVDFLQGINWRDYLEMPSRGRPLKDNKLFGPLSDNSTKISVFRAGYGGSVVKKMSKRCPRVHRDWYRSAQLDVVYNHESRGHMKEDLVRYMFASVWAEIEGRSPTLEAFPRTLLPNHRNAVESATSNSLFADRFRVQVEHKPSTTVTSHISKDGHGFIHYDPVQCRALTVREAARLQTFPDDYCFLGPRTSQYHQVGNAVPPFLAHQIAEKVAAVLNSKPALAGKV